MKLTMQRNRQKKVNKYKLGYSISVSNSDLKVANDELESLLKLIEKDEEEKPDITLREIDMIK